MKIITISREFGSGGRELGKRLADYLGYDYYDREIITKVAQNSGMDCNYVENTLSNHGWKNHTMTFRGTLGLSSYMQSSRIQLLLQQKKVIEEIAALNKDCIIVGRNADIILKDYEPFNIFVYAQKDSKLKRCMERAEVNENYTEKELLRKMKQIDKIRCETREILSEQAWGEKQSYQLLVNTTDWEIKELVPLVANYAECWFRRKK